MIYIPGQPPELQVATSDVIRWVQMELERVSALSRIQEEDIAAAAAGTGTTTGVRWDLDACYATTGALVPVWDIDELNAGVSYTAGTVRFEEGSS